MGDWIKIPQVGVILNPRQKRTQKMLARGLSMAQISRMTSTSLDVVEEDICTIHAADFMNQKFGGKMKNTRINKWSDDDLAQLIALRQTGATSKEIAVKLGRTEGAVNFKLHELRKKGALTEFVRILKELIKERGITQKKFLWDMGLNINAIGDWAKHGNIPKGDTLQRIANYFGVSVDYLLGKSNVMIDDVESEPSTQEAAPQHEDGDTHIPQCVLDTVRNEVDRITYRVTMMQSELERATAQRDELRHWLEAHTEGER